MKKVKYIMFALLFLSVIGVILYQNIQYKISQQQAATGFESSINYDNGMALFNKSGKRCIIISDYIIMTHMNGFKINPNTAFYKIYSKSNNGVLLIYDIGSKSYLIMSLNQMLFKEFNLNDGEVFLVSINGIYQLSDKFDKPVEYYYNNFDQLKDSKNIVNMLTIKSDTSKWSGLAD